MAQFNAEQTGYCKQFPEPSLPKLMAQFRFAFRFSYWCMLSPQRYTRTVSVLGRTVARAQFKTEQTDYCKTIPRPFSTQRHSLKLAQFNTEHGSTLAQFNTDVDSGIIRISKFIDRICPPRSC